MKKHELALILDFGSQYTQLIAKRTRLLNIYSEIVPFNTSFEKIEEMNPKTIILSGSPFSVTAENAPIPDKRIFEMGIPILGICYGMQLITKLFGGKVSKSDKKEYGFAQITIEDKNSIFSELSNLEDVWMSHGDAVEKLPKNFHRIAFSDNSPYAAIVNDKNNIFALQFHPEVVHTKNGLKIIKNFLIKICNFSKDWNSSSIIDWAINSISDRVGEDQVILGLSGGVDSSVTAALLHKAVGNQLIPIFVNTGLLRKNEVEEVQRIFKESFDLKLITIDAENIFLEKLKGVTNPEKKRKIIGNTFIDIFDHEASKYPKAKFLAQGTLYPDVIESVSFKGPSATIKSHHNVGGLPEKMNLKLVEPLREMFKDEVREIGRELGLPPNMVDRHPFPGPGLAIRIIGDITKEKISLLQDIDNIFIQSLRDDNLYHTTWQAFAVLLPVQSVGVMGDERTYENVCALRAVSSVDGMTADWTEFPYDFLKKVSNKIINEVQGVNRVVYDISSKPPATIEWE